jgi:hypothetical protein
VNWRTEDGLVYRGGTGGLEFNAIIDDAGHVTNGSASWIGGIPDLGIPDGTSIVSGEVFAVGFVIIPDSLSEFIVLMNIDSAHPALGSLGPTAAFGAHAASIDQLDQDPFHSSFTLNFTSFSHLGTVAVVPEPASLLLLGFGLAGMALIRQRFKS